jgi:hypothetical protein
MSWFSGDKKYFRLSLMNTKFQLLKVHLKFLFRQIPSAYQGDNKIFISFFEIFKLYQNFSY